MIVGTVIPIRYVLVVIYLLALLLVTARITHLPPFGTLVSLRSPASGPSSGVNVTLPVTVPPERANATFVVLCRNSDVDEVIRSVQSVEDRFNHKHGYPYIFLNEEPFNEHFKRRLSVLSSASMEFGIIPRDHWYAPSWIDPQKAADTRKKMEEDNIIYGGSLSYRNMCRFNSGFFFRHPLLQKYRYYWRIEPGVRFHCDIPSDPFLFMQSHNKTYGFTVSLYEYQATIPTLWETVKEYTKTYPETLDSSNSIGFISDDGGNNYNFCHFWSNFEVADMDFWRGKTYMSFFEFLDQAGGFYYERWGDAPVHSIAAALFLPRSSIHFFDEIGYEHPPITHCPTNEERWANGRCSCSLENSFDYAIFSCLQRWENINSG